MKIIHILLLGVALCLSAKILVGDNWNSHGDDFAPLYIAAGLVAEGKTLSLYEHHPSSFDLVPSGEFTRKAEEIGFEGFLHAYVHLPLVSLLCRPLIYVPYYDAVKCLLLINYCAVVLSLLLILRMVSGGFDVLWLSIAVVGIAYFSPLRYGMWLGQTSPLVFLGITCSYYLYSRGYAKVSGGLLGAIISFKIIPIFLMGYFLIRKNWLLTISSFCSLILVGIASIMLLGWETNTIFLQNIITLSKFSMASWNNQSLDGLLLRWVMDTSSLFTWHLLPLSFEMKMVKYAVLVAVLAVWFIMLTRHASRGQPNRDIIDFSFTLIVMLFISPVTWSHYLIILVFPYIVIAHTLIHNTMIPYRLALAAITMVSYMAVAFSPLFLPDAAPPLLAGKVSLRALSSLGFLGEALLLITFSLPFIRQRTVEVTHHS